MSYFDSAGTHFWHSDIMKFGDFYNTMLSSYGGILAYVVRKSESRLRYCFNTLPLDDTDVDALLMSIESDPNDAASTTVLRGIYNSLKSASPVASNNFTNPASEEWATVFAQYSNTLPIKFKELVDSLTSRGDLGVDNSDIAVALKTCSLKVWVVLACDHMSQDLPSFPFLSSSSFIAMASHLKVIKSALLEDLSLNIESDTLSPTPFSDLRTRASTGVPSGIPTLDLRATPTPDFYLDLVYDLRT
ncbi:hypothetical protein EDC04DRAFT_2891216 [Pisolithus marmoratus]|nr:hypothetical protein EDC04DRAFT_2891216 [Pisolithus marmoratus]